MHPTNDQCCVLSWKSEGVCLQVPPCPLQIRTECNYRTNPIPPPSKSLSRLYILNQWYSRCMVTQIISSWMIYHIILRFVDLFCIGISQTDTALTIHFLKTGCFWHNRTAIHYAFSTTRNKQVGKIKLHFDHGIKRSISHPLGVHKMMDNWLMYSASENAI